MNTNLEAEKPSAIWKDTTLNWTWKAIILHALTLFGGEATLKQLYELIEAHPRTKDRQFWRDRMRQVLQAEDEFVRVSEGVWALSSKYDEGQIAEFQRLRREKWPLLGPRKKATE